MRPQGGRVLRALSELKPLRRIVRADAANTPRHHGTAASSSAVTLSDHDLFVRHVGAVTPLAARHQARHEARTPPRERPLQQQLDIQAVLQEALSDEFDATTLLEVDDQLSYRRPGIGPDVTRRLRRGDWAIQRHIDLHGLRRDQARDALAQFIQRAHRQGLRCVRVVHGKGLGSPGKTPVLKGRVQSWLVQKQEVLAFVQARPCDGGAGALVVLLAGAKTSSPKAALPA
ncbi:MAG: Smr/MutS family protein [Rhodoferax sp.]